MKNQKRILKVLLVGVVVVFLLTILSTVALASSTGMPWETPLQTIENSLSGPVAKTIGVIAIIITGLMYALGESGSFFHKGVGIVFGLSVAFSASTFLTSMFNKSSGLPF